MNVWKKVISVMLVAVMCITVLPVSYITAADSVQIPDDAVKFNGHYYKVYEDSKTWIDAKAFCEGLGGHLVTIGSQKENDFVTELASGCDEKIFSIGFTDSETEGEWVWVTGESNTYTNWGFRQPDNQESAFGLFGGQDYCCLCAKYDASSECEQGQWDDFNSIFEYGFICEWEQIPEDEPVKVFPEGYDFEEDSYNFENYSANISKKYFTTMYEPSHGKKLYDAGAGKTAKNGVCFGMAYTTCAINDGFPAVNAIYNIVGDQKLYYNNLRGVEPSSKVVINGNEISIDDYIKYAYVYQWSAEHNSISSSQFKNYLLDSIENKKMGVVLIEKWETNDEGEFVFNGRGDKKRIGGHAVAAIGIEQQIGYYNALIDDPNESDSYRIMFISEGNDMWSFRDYSSIDCTFRFAVDTHMPYRILATGNKTTMSDDAIKYNSINSKETYIENMDKLSADKVLLSVEGGDFVIGENSTYQKIPLNGFTGDYEENSVMDMFWVDSNSISVSDFTGENNVIELAGDNTILTANVTKDSTVEMTIDEDDINTVIETEEGKEYTVSVETIITDENYENVETEVIISGTASADEITATQTDTGLVVTGIDKGTITLTQGEEIVATKRITEATGDVEITYDASGETTDLDADYEHECDDYNHNGKCDICTEVMEAVKNCDCMCHKKGFMAFVYAFVNLFWRLMGTNKSCGCGVHHW